MERRGRSAKLDSGGEKMMSKIVRVEDGESVGWSFRRHFSKFT